MKTSTALSIGAAAALAGAYAFIARPLLLQWGSTSEERQYTWPGDELAPGGHVTSMRAVTIDASPVEVWPWILQIGQDRAGFYSYQLFENIAGANMPRVEEVIPEFQHRFVGDTVWLSDPHTYGGKAKMIVGDMKEHCAMILISPEDWERQVAGKPIAGGTWGFILQPAPGGKTRLLMRSVSSAGAISREQIRSLLWELPHFIMERRMMLHLKALVENAVDRRVILETIEIEVEPA